MLLPTGSTINDEVGFACFKCEKRERSSMTAPPRIPRWTCEKYRMDMSKSGMSGYLNFSFCHLLFVLLFY